MVTNWSGVIDHYLPCIFLMKIPLIWQSALKQCNVLPGLLAVSSCVGKHVCSCAWLPFFAPENPSCVALAVAACVCLGLTLTSMDIKGWDCGWWSVTLVRVRKGEPHWGKSSPAALQGAGGSWKALPVTGTTLCLLLSGSVNTPFFILATFQNTLSLILTYIV